MWGLTSNRIREGTVRANWSEVVPSTAPIVSGTMAPSEILRLIAS